MQKGMDNSQKFRIDALLAEERPRLVPHHQGRETAVTPSTPLSQMYSKTSYLPLHGLYPAPLYHLPTLGTGHPHFPYGGFTGVPAPEHIKAASLPLEHWLRAGLLLHRGPELHCEYQKVGRVCHGGEGVPTMALVAFSTSGIPEATHLTDSRGTPDHTLCNLIVSSPLDQPLTVYCKGMPDFTQVI